MRQSEQSAPRLPQSGLRQWRSGRQTVHGGRPPQSRGHTTGGSGNTSRLGAPFAIVSACSYVLTLASTEGGSRQGLFSRMASSSMILIVD